MKKILYLSFCIFLAAAGWLFAGGEAESGRSNAIDNISEGQFINMGTIDSSSYLNDFAFEKTVKKNQPLSIWAEIDKSLILNKGDLVSLRLSLKSNQREYFKEVKGNYIFFYQDPVFLLTPQIESFLFQLIESNKSSNFYVYDANNKLLNKIEDLRSISSTLSTLSTKKKLYNNQLILHELLRAIQKQLGNSRSHVCWVSNENIIESPADTRMFQFSVNLLGGQRVTFSYVGYGEVPDWGALNTSLVQNNGNSYYAGSIDQVFEKIQDDLLYFLNPAIEDIQISFTWSKHVKEQAFYYPDEYYRGIEGFRPRIHNQRPRASHYIGGMNFNEKRRFIHYVYVPPVLKLQELKEDSPLIDGNKLHIGDVHIKYYIPMDKSYGYVELPLDITYGNSIQNVMENMNTYVVLDTIIQNTPLVLMEVGMLVNNARNYLAALELIQRQRELLERFRSVREDNAISEDIQMFSSYYDELIEQAKTMNLIQTF